MSKTYLPYEPDQQLLLPAALREWLPDDHLAYFISDVVDQLDMSKVTARYERERRGGSRVPGSGVIRGRGSGERETTASSLAGKEESSRKEDNSGQGKDGPAGAIAQGGNGR